MSEMEVYEVKVPQLGANDDVAILDSWIVEEGQYVNKGDQLCVVETTKSAIDLDAPADGIVSLCAEVGGECSVGSLVALIGGDMDSILQWKESSSNLAVDPNNLAPEATKKAIKLAKELNIDLSSLAVDGVIREMDVRKFSESIENIGAGKPAVLIPDRCKLDPGFLEHLKRNSKQFSALNSDFKIDLYRNAGARIGEGVVLGKNSILIAEHIEIGDGVIIEDNSTIRASSISFGSLGQFREGFDCDCRHIRVGSEAFFARGVVVGRGGNREPTANLLVGDRVFVGERVLLNTGMPITIADGCFIGQFTSVMTHNIGYSYLDGYDNAFSSIVIGKDVQVGFNCFLYPGIEIGEGGVVSSNSSVVSSLPPGKMAAGVPAKVLKDARREISQVERNRRLEELRKRFSAQLNARGITAEDSVIKDKQCLKIDVQGVLWSILFVTEMDSSISFESPSIVISMEGGDWIPGDGDAYFNLKSLEFLGDVTPVSEGVREFLRKAGIKLSPWPWRYKGGIL